MAPSALRRATTQACMLNILSTTLAQILRHYRKSGQFSPLGALEPVAIIQFLIFCILSTPPNFLWQEFLENHFPGYPQPPKKVKVDDDGKGVTIDQPLSLKNTTIKFLLDQTFGAVGNNAGFLIGITAIRGGGWNECMAVLQSEFWPLMGAAAKLWPAVSLFNFLVVPAEKRVVVGSVVGLFWGIFMVLKVSE
ncbi:hypothetical protein MMC10_009253 [Thelotrema lepadinum]|nr:hypothetical protein [Thelotrema lepadinum]